MRTNTVDLSNVIPFPHVPGHAREPGFVRLEWWVPAEWKDTIETAFERAIEAREGNHGDA